MRPDEGGVTFVVVAPQVKFGGAYRLNLIGRHQVLNALLAVAVGAEFGMDRAAIQKGLAEAKPAKMRMQAW